MATALFADARTSPAVLTQIYARLMPYLAYKRITDRDVRDDIVRCKHFPRCTNIRVTAYS